jgi:hypothetical protein
VPNSTLFSHNSALFSHNSALFSHNSALFSHNSALFSHNSALFSHNSCEKKNKNKKNRVWKSSSALRHTLYIATRKTDKLTKKRTTLMEHSP